MMFTPDLNKQIICDLYYRGGDRKRDFQFAPYYSKYNSGANRGVSRCLTLPPFLPTFFQLMNVLFIYENCKNLI